MTITTSPPPIYRGLKEYTKSDEFFFQSAAALSFSLFFFFFWGSFLFSLSFVIRVMEKNKRGKRLSQCSALGRRGKNRGPEREVFKEKERDR